MDKNIPQAKAPKDRDDRLKAALKANLARRKAQMKARSGDKAADRAVKPNGKG